MLGMGLRGKVNVRIGVSGRVSDEVTGRVRFKPGITGRVIRAIRKVCVGDEVTGRFSVGVTWKLVLGIRIQEKFVLSLK